MIKALYAGSFDPITFGHTNIIRRASKICDKLTVGVISNPQKKPLFTVGERVCFIREALRDIDNIEVSEFTGLLADYVNEEGFDIVIRGLRGISDFDNEIQMAQMNAVLYNDKVETIFLMTDPRYSFLSSSMAKEVCMLNGNIEGLVPDNVLKSMKEKLR